MSHFTKRRRVFKGLTSSWNRTVMNVISVTDGSVFSRGEGEQLDVDLVLTALREFQQKLRDTQKERVCLTRGHKPSNSEWEY